MIVVLFPDEFSQIIKKSAPQIETERLILGFDHVELGGKAAQHWNLPLAIQEAIEQHNTPPEPGAAKSLALLVYTANLLVSKAKLSDASALEEHEPIRAALAMLNVPIAQATCCADNGLKFADQVVSPS